MVTSYTAKSTKISSGYMIPFEYPYLLRHQRTGVLGRDFMLNLTFFFSFYYLQRQGNGCG